MDLHRDIFWVGRQWAVTGYGLQAVNRRLHRDFDIQASRIWDDDLLERLSAHAWFNPEDFGKGLAVARSRYPAPPGKAAPSRTAVSALQESNLPSPPKAAPVTESPKPVAPKPAAQPLEMRVGRWPAKFTLLWRVRIRR